MQPTNIDKILLFAVNDSDGRVLSQEDFVGKYGFEPDGANFYYGVNPANYSRFQTTGAALDAVAHRPFFDDILASLSASSQGEKTVVLGLEPSNVGAPYDFVMEHLDLVTTLADELLQYQQSASRAGKRLNIVVRFASEMNDQSQTQGGNPAGFKSAFAAVRPIFLSRAPDVLFSFSPAIRADLKEAELAGYWPGDAVVDVIGGTWYIGSPAQTQASIDFLRAYLLHRQDAGKPFALSEVGGCDASGQNNDQVLGAMFQQLETLNAQNISFKYVTVFLQGKWGADAELSFLL